MHIDSRGTQNDTSDSYGGGSYATQAMQEGVRNKTRALGDNTDPEDANNWNHVTAGRTVVECINPPQLGGRGAQMLPSCGASRKFYDDRLHLPSICALE